MGIAISPFELATEGREWGDVDLPGEECIHKLVMEATPSPVQLLSPLSR